MKVEQRAITFTSVLPGCMAVMATTLMATTIFAGVHGGAGDDDDGDDDIAQGKNADELKPESEKKTTKTGKAKPAAGSETKTQEHDKTTTPQDGKDRGAEEQKIQEQEETTTPQDGQNPGTRKGDDRGASHEGRDGQGGRGELT